MGAVFTASAIFKGQDKLSKTYRQMSKAGKTFAKKTEIAFAKVERRVRKLKNAVGGLGLVMGGALLLTAATSVISVFADFEQANASLAAVMNVTVKENKELAVNAKFLGATTAKTATEVIGLQEAFARLGFERKSILNMTSATISGSVAMQSELADTAELVGAMVKSFDNFESVNAPQIIDQLTRSTQKSALNFEKLQTALPIVAGAANAAKVPFTKLLSSLGNLSDAGIDASSSSTALRNIFLEAAKRGVPYEKLLGKISKSTDKLTLANKLFGKRGAVAAVILAKNTKQIIKLDKALQNAGGTAGVAAAKQLNTLKGSVTILGSAWEGFILSIEDGNGSISNTLKTIVKVATEMLSMASGTAKAADKLTDTELAIRKLAEQGNFLIKTLKWVVVGFLAIKTGMLAFKAVMLVNSVILAAFNVALGINAAMSGASAFAVHGNAVAYGAFRAAVLIATAAQWLFNVAMTANPIGLIIVGIAALIAIIVLLVVKWKDIVNWVKTSDSGFAKFVRTAFGGIMKVGKIIVLMLIQPLRAVLLLLNKISFGKIGGDALAKVNQFQANLVADIDGTPKQELSTTKTTAAQESISREEIRSKQEVSVNINDNTGSNFETEAVSSFPVQMSKTNE